MFSGFADVYPSVGYGSYFKLGDQEIAVGASIKGILRTSFYNEETGAEFYTEDAESILNKFNSGEKISAGIPTYTLNGVGLDLGMLGKFDLWDIDGRYGFALKNIGSNLSGTKLLKVNGNSVEESTTFEIPIVGTFGFGGKTYLPLLLDITMACDVDIISPEQSVYKRLHFGIEKKLFSILNLRGGINQGNFVGGFGIDLFGFFHLDYAYNVREFGDEIGEDRVTYHVFEIGLI